MTDFDQRDHRVQVGRRNGETSDVSMADLINDLREGVVVQGADGRIFLSNSAAEEILGLTADQIAGRSSTDSRWRAIHEDGSPFPGDEHPAMVTLATGEAVRDVVMGVHKPDGTLTWILINSDPICAEGQRQPYAVANFFTDITAVHALEGALERTGRSFRRVLDSMLDPVVFLHAERDGSGRVIDFVHEYANDAACKWLGREYEDLAGTRLTVLFPAHMASALVDSYREVIEKGEPLVLDNVAMAQEQLDGGDSRFDVRAVPLDGGLTVTWRDVSARSEWVESLARSEERYRLLIANASDVVAHLRGGVLVWVSPSVRSVLEWNADEIVNSDFMQIVHADDRFRARTTLERVELGQSVGVRVRVSTRDNSYHWVDIHARPFLNAAGEPDGISASMRVVDAEVAAAADLWERATHDALTGLANRGAAIERVTSTLSHEPRTGSLAALLFCDIDNFKAINDTYGHLAGDEVLRVLADRLARTVRQGDWVARFGGDEFLVLLNGVRDPSDATRVANAIAARARESIRLGDADIRVTVSIGVTTAAAGEDVDALMARADEAMYAAKGAGKDQVVTVLR
ncbi:MAG: diguanylate cyclase [Actinobacteria bacterium]|nr:diguanylate cyclase [Actinomycetota bacterium]